MGAKRVEPYTKICITMPDALLERLREYPGDQSWKIVMCVEYALQMGALMQPEEARKLMMQRAEEIAKLAGPSQKFPQKKSG